jgi:hypothetical protein
MRLGTKPANPARPLHARQLGPTGRATARFDRCSSRLTSPVRSSPETAALQAWVAELRQNLADAEAAAHSAKHAPTCFD